MECLQPQSEQQRSIASQVRTDRLQQLFRQSVSAVVGAYVGAGMLCWLSWEHIDHAVAIAWMSALTGATLLRVVLFVAYFRSPESERTAQRWERSYFVTLAMSAGVWGVGALAVMPPGDLLTQTQVVLFTVGMSVSAVSCYSAYRSMTLMSIGFVLLPCTFWLLFQSSVIQVGMALAVLVFLSFVLMSTRTLSDSLEKAFRLSREMEQANSISSFAAQTDELTGLKNRRAFFEHAHLLHSHCKRNQLPLCALMMDMDHFKQINDTHGHQVGDQVLRQIAGVINATFRKSDVHGRLGGEEFAVLLPDTSLEVARAMAEAFIQTIATLKQQPVERLTASLGIACTVSGDNDLHHLMNKADQALYRAKALGRNQVAE
jgi:diguanylate cyclase (GGDEF)-like protein